VEKLKRANSAVNIFIDNKADMTMIDEDWTARWNADPSIKMVKMPQKTTRMTVANLFQEVEIRNQLCMAIVAEVNGHRRVVGLVQAFNKRVAKRHSRYEDSKKIDELAFRPEDVDSLEVFCMQIADLVEMKGKEAEYEDALKRDDGIGSMLRSMSEESSGVSQSPKTSGSARQSTGVFKTAVNSTIATNKFAGAARSSSSESAVKIEDLRQWGYGCLDLKLSALPLCATQMVHDLGLLTDFGIAEETFFTYADAVFNSYHQVPYHNMYHGFNVMQGCYVFCSTMAQGKLLNSEEKLGLMLSAMGHDSGHDGVNSAFHVASESNIATLYNDLSTLENMHARETFELMKGSGCDILCNMDGGAKKALKASMVPMIISTDMKFHKEKEVKLQKANKCKHHRQSSSCV